jgi:hypothetical protein
MHGVQTIGVTGGCVVDVVDALCEADLGACRSAAGLTECGWDDECAEEWSDEPVADESEGVEAAHPAKAAATATTRMIRTRDPTNLLATPESVARPG